MSIFRLLALPATCLLLLGLAPARAQSLADAAKAAGAATFLKALQDTGLDQEIAKGKFTLFAPTDQAFEALGPDALKDKAAVKALLRHHVVKGALNVGQALVAGKLTSLDGGELSVGIQDAAIRVAGAALLKANVAIDSGYLHAIDKVIVPPPSRLLDVAATTASCKLLVQAIEAAGLDKTLAGKGPFTLFAPSDAAFAAAAAELLTPDNKERLEEVLKNHVVAGTVSVADLLSGASFKTLAGHEISADIESGEIQVDGVGVGQTDLEAENGIVHVLNGLLLPPEAPALDTPAALVAESVRIGAALFNGKNRQGCVDVYLLTIHALLQMPASTVPDSARGRLETLLEEAGKEKDAGTQAWALRKGLDEVHDLLQAAR